MRKSIDKDVFTDYNAGVEKDRLRIDLGYVKFAHM